MESIESEGRTVSEAVDNALKKSGLRRDQVEVQILQEHSAGFMGIGARPARIRITEKRWEPHPSDSPATPARPLPAGAGRAHRSTPKTSPRESVRTAPAAPSRGRAPLKTQVEEAAPVDPQAACAKAKEIFESLLRLAGAPDAVLGISWDTPQERVKIKIEGESSEHLLGQEGRTLESLQLLATLMLSRNIGSPTAVSVDILDYWENREQMVLAQARKGLEHVRSTGKPFRLAPMDAAMRRLVHRDLAGQSDVVTSSEGEGSWRKVVLRPRKKA